MDKSKVEQSILTICYAIVGLFIGAGVAVIGMLLETFPIMGQIITIILGFIGFLAASALYLIAVQSRREE